MSETAAPRRGGWRPAGRIAVVAAVLTLGALGLAAPGAILRGGVAWAVFLLAVASGWGYLVARLGRVADPDLGLRAAWGLCAYLGVAGLLLAVGLLSRPAILALVALGACGFAWRELVTPVPAAARAAQALRWVRANPGLGVLAVVLGLLAVVNLVGAVAMLERNPWDDDLAYTPLVKRLLDAGDLIEPFSFRRLSAYGGQTALQALAGARDSLATIHLLDRGLCQLLVLLLAAGHAKERGTQALYVVLLGLVLMLLPDTEINTAAAWSGAALFLALYRTVGRGHWGLVGLVGAATCTLRQNYLVVVILFVALALFASRRESWRVVRANLGLVLGVAVVAMLPWWIASYRSSGTFLFPLVDGTFNHALSLQPGVMSWAEKLAYLLWASIETSPLVVIPVLFAVLCVTRDRRSAAPLWALTIAAHVGFYLLVLGFAGTEPFHLWRYAFGFSLALFVAMVTEIGAGEGTEVVTPSLGRWLLVAALALQILVGRGAITKRFAALGANVREAALIDRRGDAAADAEQARYRALQAAVPAGAPVLVMLDDPWLLDFARNPIANLDTPGFASPGPQLPMFRGPEAVRSYLVAQGYRYVLFVRSDHSRYFFRRPFWVWRLFNDGELFAAMSAYTIDAIDTFAQLAASPTATVIHDRDGLVALDLGTTAPLLEPVGGTEAQRRDEWVRLLANREGLHDAWSLTTRGDLRFEDGVGPLAFVDGSIDDPAWFEIVRPKQLEAMRGTPIRALYRRAHLRVRGERAMTLRLRAVVALNVTYTRPRLDISLDGELLASAVADERGRYDITLAVPAEKLAGGWHDLYLVSSSIAEPDRDVRDLRVSRLELVEWR
ncbi:MAG: hypothetical protein JNL83_36315 [Myxococcales bacterium]|nr:hypothetical protein [Myxococcales bacterium]